MVNPGEMPFALRLTVNLPGAGPVSSPGPRNVSAGVTDARLVNQLESGTSSMLLMLSARPISERPGRPNRLITESKTREISRGAAFDASCVSTVRLIGSSS
jgi:hypothetical protein